MGDYVDAYGQTQNTRLYLNDLDFLFLWKKRMENRRIKVVNLIGNHDVPYLIFSPKSYSLVDEQGFRKVSLKLSRLNLQVAFQLGNYLVSHAGFIDGYSLKEWHLKPLRINNYELNEDVENLIKMEEQVGFGRGGYGLGSPIWADFEKELLRFSTDYPKQIVGHTPRKQIVIKDITDIDTFTVLPSSKAPFLKNYGSGELLLFEDNNLRSIQLDWNLCTAKRLNKYFESTQRICRFGEIAINFDDWSVTIFNEKFVLTNKEFDIFLYLFENKNKYISKKNINENVLSKYVNSENSIEFIMKKLMKKMNNYIENVGELYIFKC